MQRKVFPCCEQCLGKKNGDKEGFFVPHGKKIKMYSAAQLVDLERRNMKKWLRKGLRGRMQISESNVQATTDCKGGTKSR